MSDGVAHVFRPSPVMAAFMRSDAYARVLAGPMGGGKSVCCTHTLLEWATLQQADSRGERRSRFLIVRNTRDQLMSTTWKTVTEWIVPGDIAKGDYAEWKATEKTLYIQFPHGDTIVKSEWLFIALDEPADVRKALSLEATGAWLNEARELHPDVIDGLLGRVNRYPPPKDGTPITRAGVILDTNMPAEETWFWEQMEEPPANWTIHVQPPAILNKGYYSNLIPGKKPDYIRAFLRCEYARSMAGMPVYEKTFKPEFHIAKEVFKPIASEAYPVTVGLDFGRTPSAIFLQKDPRGRVIALSEVTSENMGLETFITTKLKPHIYEKYQRCSLIVAPDPAGDALQQIGEITMYGILRAAGFKVAKPITNDPDKRIQCVERLLMLQLDGAAAFLVNQECTTLIRGCRYGYRYKTKKNGEQEDRPEKNSFSHTQDALQYGCLIIEAGATGSYVFKSEKREVKTIEFGRFS